MMIIKKRYPHSFLSCTTLSYGTLALFVGCALFSSSLIAQSFPSGLFAQDVVPEVFEEEACSFSAPEVAYPYTQLHASLFQRTQTTALPPLTQPWVISCSQPIVGMQIFVSGDGAASSVTDGDPAHFGLGHVNGQGNLGYYTVTLDNAQVDGQPVQLYQSTQASVMGLPQSAVLLQSALFQGWVTAAGTSVSGQQFSVNLTVSPTLNSLQETHGPLVEGAELKGDLALTFSFGV